MSTIAIGNVTIDPIHHPAVLNTATWNPAAAWEILESYPDSSWDAILTGLHDGQLVQPEADNLKTGALKLFSSSLASKGGVDYFLAELPDKQNVILSVAEHRHESPLGTPAFSKEVRPSLELSMFNADDSTLHAYLRHINPRKGPRAMGAVPRLGIGSRHSTMAWPAILRAMEAKDFSANTIMNSVRELAILSEFLEGREPRTNHLFGFGPIPEAYTGGTFEGIWTSGVLSAIKSDYSPRYGADADHLQVKRGAEGIARTKQFIDSARYFTFYTLDVSDVLDYDALRSFSSSQAVGYLERLIPDAKERRDVLSFHRQKTWIGKREFQLDEATIGRLVGKYWVGLDYLDEINGYLEKLKDGETYDLELTIDEVPPELETFDVITHEEELLFLIHESSRRGLPVTHVAPNFGVEKATDYRGPDGLPGLEERVSRLYHIASEYGLMLDCHSGDDLSKATRRAFGRATKGRLHFKISPTIGDVFSRVLYDLHPDVFSFWWDDTINYAEASARSGSAVAVDLLNRWRRSDDPAPSPEHVVFKEFKVTAPGRKNESGELVHRRKFYDLSEDFREEFTRRLDLLLREIAEDVFEQGQES